MTITARFLSLVCLALLPAQAAVAEPWAAPGDLFLKHDVELLVDAGVISVPVTTWPMSWGNLARATAQAVLPDDASAAVALALERLRALALDNTRSGEVRLESTIAGAKNPQRLRSFEDTPRENGEFSSAISQTWERLSGRAEFTYAANPQDGKKYRFDGSYLSFIWGNTTFTAGWQDKWWGPGRDGALALSTNARPVPGVLVKRNFTDPFQSRWLSWIGPWTASFFLGELESARAVPNAKLVGARIAFRPLEALEIGLTRTGQWGGEGRNESLDSFVDLILGRDNVGEDGLDRADEPGNQLAGYDWRWRIIKGNRPVVFYGQLIGEDEAGGFPSRFLGQFGVSMSMPVGTEGASLHANAEFSDTTCQFYEASKLFNCAYNNSLYPSGYRYRGRPIGQSTDNDARQYSFSATLLTQTGERYTAKASIAELNRGGSRDDTNFLSPLLSDLINFEFSHERYLFSGRVSAGFGADFADSDVGGLDATTARVFVNWHKKY